MFTASSRRAPRWSWLPRHRLAGSVSALLISAASFGAQAQPALSLDQALRLREKLDAQRDGALARYVCDFPSPALHGNPKVIALPHLGASTAEAEENCAVMVADQLRDYLEHGNIANAVNFPQVSMARESAYRVAIANANVPNMLGQISTAMARAGLNIHNMVNKSRGDMAYTLVDVDSPVAASALAEIAAIQGVLSVRSLPLIT